jgi:hypothetical protein
MATSLKDYKVFKPGANSYGMANPGDTIHYDPAKGWVSGYQGYVGPQSATPSRNIMFNQQGQVDPMFEQANFQARQEVEPKITGAQTSLKYLDEFNRTGEDALRAVGGPEDTMNRQIGALARLAALRKAELNSNVAGARSSLSGLATQKYTGLQNESQDRELKTATADALNAYRNKQTSQLGQMTPYQSQYLDILQQKADTSTDTAATNASKVSASAVNYVVNAKKNGLTADDALSGLIAMGELTQDSMAYLESVYSNDKVGGPKDMSRPEYNTAMNMVDKWQSDINKAPGDVMDNYNKVINPADTKGNVKINPALLYRQISENLGSRKYDPHDFNYGQQYATEQSQKFLDSLGGGPSTPTNDLRQKVLAYINQNYYPKDSPGTNSILQSLQFPEYAPYDAMNADTNGWFKQLIGQ